MKTTERHLIDMGRMVMLRQWLSHTNTYYIAGTDSIYVPSRKEKYMIKERVRDWPDLDGVMVPMTPGEAARTELKREFPNLKKVGWRRPEVKLFDWRWPMYFAKPFFAPMGVYIDLKGAYHQIYRDLWLDTTFPMGFGNYHLQPIATRLKHWKQARNALIGVTIARTATGIKGAKRVRLSIKNTFLSPGLWATIQAVLNEIAGLAVACGAMYVATDGYIFPGHANVELFHKTLDVWGFNYRMVEGRIVVNGWGSYKVGAYRQTTNYANGRPGGQKPIDTIKVVDPDNPTKFTEWLVYKARKYNDYAKKYKEGQGSWANAQSTVSPTGDERNSSDEGRREKGNPVHGATQLSLLGDDNDD